MSVPPTHRLGFVDSDSVASIAYSADSKEIFVALNIESTNLWWIIVEHWPYTFGAAALLVALVGALMLRRVLGRPRKKGRRYCRRCNHEVSDPALPCPECGTPLNPPRRIVKGKSLWRRTVLAFAVIAIAVIGYGWLWTLPPGRIESTWDLFHWWCGPLHRFAEANHIKLVNGVIDPPFTRIAVIDVATGKRVRDLGTFAGYHSPFGDMKITVSPDGKYLYLPDRSTDLIAIDTQRGRVERRLRLNGSSLINQISGITPNAETVYATFHDQNANRVSLVR